MSNVLIPMVGSTGTICRVSCDQYLAPEHPAQLDRRLSPLLECGLYSAGQQAIASAKALRLPGSGYLADHAFSLNVINQGDVIGLSPENARSAELGLALAWLGALTGHTRHAISATGLLDPISENKVKVGPIHYLREKLDLLIAYYSKPTSSEPPQFFLIPSLDPDQKSTPQKYHKEIEQLRLLGVTVIAVDTLAQACQILGFKRIGRTRFEKKLLHGLSALSLVICTLLGANLWLSRDLHIQFANVAMNNGHIQSTPTRASLEQDGTLSILEECRSNAASKIPKYRVGDQLAVKISPISEQLPVFGLAVAITERGGIQVFALPNRRLDITQGNAFSVDLTQVERHSLFMVIGRRLLPYDVLNVQKRLMDWTAKLAPEERLSGARNWLSENSSGHVEHFFDVVEPEECH